MEMFFSNSEQADFAFYATLPVYWMIILISTYFIKRVLIICFMMQIEAEKTGDALTQVLDNLPDGVLMFEND